MISDIERRKRSAIQINRVDAIFAQKWPGMVVNWESNPVENTLRFYVETQYHVRVIESSGNLPLEELEKLTDDQLCELLVSLSGGKL